MTLTKKILIILAAILIAGGSILIIYMAVDSPKQVQTPSVPQTESTAQTQPNQNKNPLTGEMNLPDSAVGKQPVSIMVSNSQSALPQAGIGQADLVYETVVEGGITRIMALFADPNAIPLTGPVRSVREYYIDLAAPFNPVFVHFGGSETGYTALKNANLSEIDGMTSPNAFYQDNALASLKGKEHSYFVSSQTLQSSLAAFENDRAFNYPDAFAFSNEPSESSQTATSVHVPFSTSYVSDFVYDASTQKYLKSQFAAPQIDKNTGEQIAVDNVFILYANVTGASDGSERREIDFSSGMGVYCTKGGAVNMMWSKDSQKSPFLFLSEDGDELKVSPGQSWVCIIPVENKTSVTIS